MLNERRRVLPLRVPLPIPDGNGRRGRTRGRSPGPLRRAARDLEEVYGCFFLYKNIMLRFTCVPRRHRS